MESLGVLKKVFNAGNFINYYEKIIILLLLIISLKSFYLIYLSLFLIWLYQFKFFVFKKQMISIFSSNIFTYIFIGGLSLSVLHIFLNTGCLVYPASFTCFDNFQWAIPIEQVQQMKSWYSLWSKAGASPTFRTEDPELYLVNFNWIYHWIKTYFFTKGTDAIFVISLISIICLFTLKNIKNKTYVSYNHNYNPLFIILIILFLEWFINHPALRYGGYTLLALMFFIPLSIFLEKKVSFNNKFKKKVIILIIIALSFFVIKNISRLNKEYLKYQYNILSNPYFHINENSFYFQKILADLQRKYKKDNDSFYLILNYNLINNDN